MTVSHPAIRAVRRHDGVAEGEDVGLARDVADVAGDLGVITLTQPKVPAAKVRGPREGFQCVLVSPDREGGCAGSGRWCQGVLWDPRDPLSYQPSR